MNKTVEKHDISARTSNNGVETDTNTGGAEQPPFDPPAADWR